jgi:hypothetical protein
MNIIIWLILGLIKNNIFKPIIAISIFNNRKLTSYLTSILTSNHQKPLRSINIWKSFLTIYDKNILLYLLLKIENGTIPKILDIIYYIFNLFYITSQR